MTAPVLRPGIYRHYKGPEYRVHQLARHSETEEWMVVYQTCYGAQDWWIRPLDMFTESVMLEGRQVPRFEFVRED